MNEKQFVVLRGIDYFYITQITITLFAVGLFILLLNSILEKNKDSQKKSGESLGYKFN